MDHAKKKGRRGFHLCSNTTSLTFTGNDRRKKLVGNTIGKSKLKSRNDSPFINQYPRIEKAGDVRPAFCKGSLSKE